MRKNGTLTRIWQRVTMPRAVEEEKKLREHITRVVLALTLVALIFFAGLVVLGWAGGVFDFFPLALTVGLVLMVSGALWLAINGHWELAGLLPPLAFYCVGIYGTYTHGLAAETNLLYAVAILLAAMIRSGREQWLIFAVSALTHVILGWMRDPSPVEVKLSATLTVSGSLLGITLLQWLFARRLRRALASSRAYGAVLKEYRNHLKDLVEQRTAELGRTNNARTTTSRSKSGKKKKPKRPCCQPKRPWKAGWRSARRSFRSCWRLLEPFLLRWIWKASCTSSPNRWSSP